AKSSVVQKALNVNLPVERVFAVFTENMGAWWPATHHIAKQAFTEITVEPRAGARWCARSGDGGKRDWGRGVAGEPPHRVVSAWHLQPDWKFDPDPEKASEV